MSSLIKYEAARLALAECKSIDEAKDWADKAEAMRAYGRMAKDKSMEIDAAEIRLRAERRLGELILAQKESVGLNKGVRMAGKAGSSAVVTNDHREIPTLADAGISKDLSSRAQKYAAVPPAEFDAIVENWRDKVSEEGVRVSLQLQAAGEKQAKKEPALPDSQPVSFGIVAKMQKRVEELEAENQSLRDELEAMSDAAQELALSNEALELLSTDTAKTIRNLLEEKRLLEVRRDGLMNERNEYIKQVKALQRKADKLDKQNAA